MKKRINGHTYNTDTATLLAGYERGEGWSDLHYIRERLFVTKRPRRYFIAGEGGAATKYAEQFEDGWWSCGEAIVPVTAKEAKEFEGDWFDKAWKHARAN